MGWQCPPVYGKKVGYYEKKIEKINNKIKSLEEDKKIYEEIIAKQTKDSPLVEEGKTKN